MTAAVKTIKTDTSTGSLNVTYSNETKIRNCTAEDFIKTNTLPTFNDLSIYKNLFCPDNY